jgi:serine/threonine protein phosphatase PrpC
MQNYILKYPVNNAVDILVNSALKRDGSDNITAIIVKCF